MLIYEFQVPLSVVVAWTMGIDMDLDFSLLETGCLAFTIIVTAFTLQVLNLYQILSMSFVMLDIVDRFSMISYKNSSFVIIQDGTSHYMKGIVLFLCYIVIGACFFVHKIPVSKCLAKKLFILTTHVAKQYNIYVIVFNSLFNNVYNFHDR